MATTSSESGSYSVAEFLSAARRVLKPANLPMHLAVFTILLIAAAFGGVEQWALPLAWASLGLVLLAQGVALIRQDNIHIPDVRQIVMPSLCMLAVLIILVMQSGALLSPGSWHPLWKEAAVALAEPLQGAPSLTPADTRFGIGWYEFYIVLFVTVWLMGRNRAVAQAGFTMVLAAQVALALYGTLVFSTGNDTVGFITRSAYVQSLTATFVNKNSYATFVGLGVIVALASLITALRTEISRDDPWRIQLRTVIQLMLTRHFVLLLTLMLLATTLSFTGSRAGILSTGLGCGIMLILTISRRGMRRRSLILSAVLLLFGIGALAAVAGGRNSEGFTAGGAQESISDRSAMYRAASITAAKAPLLGNGLGSFEAAFAPDLTDPLVVLRAYLDAHNTFLENVIEMGWIGGIALALAPLLLAWSCFRGIFRRRRMFPFSVAGVGASILVGLHSLVDFSLEIPAVTALYLTILALGTSQSTSTEA